MDAVDRLDFCPACGTDRVNQLSATWPAVLACGWCARSLTWVQGLAPRKNRRHLALLGASRARCGALLVDVELRPEGKLAAIPRCRRCWKGSARVGA